MDNRKQAPSIYSHVNNSQITILKSAFQRHTPPHPTPENSPKPPKHYRKTMIRKQLSPQIHGIPVEPQHTPQAEKIQRICSSTQMFPGRSS